MTHDLIHRDRRAAILWLALCAALVACMVLVGGYTRLSGSGLSITSWKPIHGTIPPLGEAEWQEEFDAYRLSPQYQKINRGMSLGEFKTIFWPEYFHRLLGRLMGAVFFLPLVVFVLRRALSRRLAWRLAGIFALGGLQGVIGWLMVASGLVDNPNVSHLRLALHLSLAFAIFALILWTLLDIAGSGQWAVNREKLPSTVHRPLATYSLWFTLLCIQIVYGAFVAGLHAGLIFNTWPDMNGQFLPDGLAAGEPWYENIIMIQFIHRKLAVLLAVGFLFWWWRYRDYVKNNRLGSICTGVTAIIAAQFTLGVATLLNQVPLPLALAHQMTALLLFAASVVLLHGMALRKAYD